MEKSAKHIFSWQFESDGEDDPTIEQRVSTGEILARARNEHGLGVDQIADLLRLPVAVIESIENSNFHELHGKTYATGYVRAYANQLGLNSDELIENDPELGMVPYSQMPPCVYQPSRSAARSSRRTVYMGGILLRSFLGIAVIAVLAAIWMERSTMVEWWQTSFGTPTEIELPSTPAENDSLPNASQPSSDSLLS